MSSHRTYLTILFLAEWMVRSSRRYYDEQHITMRRANSTSVIFRNFIEHSKIQVHNVRTMGQGCPGPKVVYFQNSDLLAAVGEGQHLLADTHAELHGAEGVRFANMLHLNYNTGHFSSKMLFYAN